MPAAPAHGSPVGYLQALQVLVARELVEVRGEPAGRAAELLGLAPSAVSQYLSGRRGSRSLERFEGDEEAQLLAQRVAAGLSELRPADSASRVRLLLDGTQELVERVEGSPSVPTHAAVGGSRPSGEHARELLVWSRSRVRAEQRAVAQSMRLAQKARDELTRSVFRQIASDSLRHAEIVASLAPYLSRGISRPPASGITRTDVEGLVRDERRAEGRPDPVLMREAGGTIGLLLESIAADERKHDALLSGLLESGFAPRLGSERRRALPRRTALGRQGAQRAPTSAA
ncbi:MAG TPA: hypothetical protein VGU43_07795 [Thermoplasmata archaeon]|nr:hypothetical protein [Thermoplasmata archaeon]